MPPSSQEKIVGTSTRKSSNVNWLLILVVLVLGVLVLWTNKDKFNFMASRQTSEQASLSGQNHKAIFLTNGQVYFGKITSDKERYTTLTNVFYLQVQQPLQGEKAEAPTKPELKLVKLGTELHGPTDAMMINNEQILFVEDLKTDSQVVKGIEDYYKTNK